MEITLEKIDIIRERTGVGYRQAKEALERAGGNVIEALVELEDAQQKWKEEFHVKGSEVVEKIKELIHRGNVTRIKVKHDGRTLFELPVTLGAIGALVLPELAALGVLVAALKRCTLEVERADTEEKGDIPREETPVRGL